MRPQKLTERRAIYVFKPQSGLELFWMLRNGAGCSIHFTLAVADDIFKANIELAIM